MKQKELHTTQASRIEYRFTASIWQHNAPNGWYFVTLPVAMAQEIRNNLQWQEAGWGRLKATAKTGQSIWETAIWFDTKHATYLLPLKAAVRKQESLEINKAIEVIIWI
jgi:hypothetical protein